ncbi:MAG: hypothetical protein AB8B60_17945 [Sulfitobacter sp.]
MSGAFTHHAQGRSRRTLIVVALIWLALLGLWLGVEANLWIVGFLALFTLPACWDLLTDPPSGLTLTDDTLSWFSGKRRAEVALEEIDHAHMNRRLDFSVKVTLVLKTGAKVRLPFEATPPDQDLEDAFAARDVRTKRTHFQLLQ